MSGHVLRFESDWGPTVVCLEPAGSDCQLAGDPETCFCEEFTVKRDPDGTPYHEIADDLTGEVLARHEMRRVDYCNVVEFIEDGGIGDTYGGPKRDLPIKLAWHGDHYQWSLT